MDRIQLAIKSYYTVKRSFSELQKQENSRHTDRDVRRKDIFSQKNKHVIVVLYCTYRTTLVYCGTVR